MKTLHWLLHVTLATVALLWFTGCTTVGETGRRQFMFVSEAQETELGLTSFEQMKQEVPLSQDAAAKALVQRVGQRIAAVVGTNMPNAQWEFVVFESQEANAFCLPGGKIGIYTGILPITQNEAGLATVMGHEVAHATARHGSERMSQAMGIELFGKLLTGAVANKDPKVQAAVQTVYGLGSQVGVALPFSRLHESEADHVGLLYMARAGYDPEEAVKFWERFAAANQQAGAGGTMWFLRTHPVDEKRIEQLKEWMPEAKAQFRQAR